VDLPQEKCIKQSGKRRYLSSGYKHWVYYECHLSVSKEAAINFPCWMVPVAWSFESEANQQQSQELGSPLGSSSEGTRATLWIPALDSPSWHQVLFSSITSADSQAPS
jgi:hypothetical protein